MAYNSLGTLLQLGDGLGSFTTVAEVGDIAGPTVSRDTEETTSHSSNGWEEFIGTIRRTGDVTFPINWDPGDTTHVALYDLIDDDQPSPFRMIIPQVSKRWAFDAILTGFGTAFPVAGKMSADITLKVSGRPILEPNP